jgi:PAS domain S-box-containing protein
VKRVLGYKSEDMIGGSAFDLVHPHDAPRVREEFAERARTPGTGKPFEFRSCHADGSWHTFESIGTNLLDDPSVGGIVFNARDITDRKRAERALKESEERYRRLVELSPDFIGVHGGGEVLFTNAAGVELFGATSPEELTGKRVMDLIHPHYRETVRARIERTEQERERTDLLQEKFLRLDGGVVDVEAISTPITYQGEKATLVVARDITTRRRAEEERDRLFEFSLDLLCIAGLDGYLKRVNPAFEETLGYTSEELLEKPFIEFVHPEDRAATLREMESLRRGVRTVYFEKRYVRKDGSVIWLAWKTVPVVEEDLVYATARDVTERKRDEETLKRQAHQEALRAEVGAVLAGGGTLPEILRGCVEAMVTHLGAAFARVWILNEEEEVLELCASAGMYTHTDGFHGRVPVGSFKIGLIAQERQPHLTNYVLGDPRVHDKEWVRREGMVAFAGYPLIVEDRLVGVMALFARQELAEDTLKVLASVAAVISQGIQRKRAGEALEQSEQLYRTVVEQATEYIALVDVETRRFVGSNPAFREALGYTEEELRHMTLYDIVAHDRESIDENARRIVDSGRYFLGERKHRRKDGSLVDVEISASTVLYNGREVACIVGHDVTERLETLRLLEERVTALARVSANLTVGQTVEAALDSLAARVVQSTAAVACSVVLLNAETGMPHTAGSHGLPEGYTAGMQAAYRAGLRPAAMEVFRTHRPMLVRDVRQIALKQTLVPFVLRYLREAPWDTIYCVPLVYRSQALGTLNLYYPAGEEPGEDERVFLGAVADQIAVAVENAGLFAAAQGKAALEERQRLARELHDSVSQALYGIALGARTARALLGRGSPPDGVDEWLEYVLSLAEAGMTKMRALIFELRPESLETEGLIVALKQQAAALEARHEIPVHTTLGEEPDLSLETKEAIYRIAQEALHNTVKHARASRAELRFESDARGIVLEVSDDGGGFDPSRDFSGHLGLKSMRERATRLGGTLRVDSAPGGGTTIRALIPPGTQ